MKQISLFAEENRLQKLSDLGDCLERLKIIDWESFRPIIALALIRERKSNACRRPAIQNNRTAKIIQFVGRPNRVSDQRPHELYEISRS